MFGANSSEDWVARFGPSLDSLKRLTPPEVGSVNAAIPSANKLEITRLDTCENAVVMESIKPNHASSLIILALKNSLRNRGQEF